MSIKFKFLAYMVIGAFSLATLADDGYSQRKKRRKKKRMKKKEMADGGEYSAPYGMAGCGLGSLFIKSDGKIQILAASINGTGMQTSAVSSGSSNCAAGKEDMAVKEQEIFISSNLASLTKDAARGDGEYLYNLAEVMGCNDGGHFSEFAQLSQQNYSQVFADTDASQIRNRYVALISGNDILSKSCSRVITKS